MLVELASAAKLGAAAQKKAEQTSRPAMSSRWRLPSLRGASVRLTGGQLGSFPLDSFAHSALARAITQRYRRSPSRYSRARLGFRHCARQVGAAAAFGRS